MDRRTFLCTSGAALGALATMGTASMAHAAPAGVPRRLGVQLYTLRDLFPHDVVGVLETLKRIGYDEVEFAGYHGRPPEALRAVLDGIGLTAPAAHVGLDLLRDDLDAQLGVAQTMGHRYLVVPWLDEHERASADGYRRIADELNALGEKTRRAGVQLAYHNHDFEFETFGGTPGYDVLLAETDPDLVTMEMDLFWTVHGGHDPVDYFARYPGRFPLVHAKGRAADGTMTEVGAGAMDWKRLFAHAGEAGIRHAFVEHDTPADALRSVRASYAYLSGLRAP